MPQLCPVCHTSSLAEEPIPSATYMCQTCETHTRDLHEVEQPTYAIAAKKHDKTVDVYISVNRPRLQKMFGVWKSSGNLYDRIAQGEIPAKMPTAKIRQKMAQQFGAAMEKIEVHYIDNTTEAWEQNPNCQQCKKPLSPIERQQGDRICATCVKQNKGRVWGNDRDDNYIEEVATPFTQGDHVILLAVPKTPTTGMNAGYWKIGADVYRAPVENVMFDNVGAPMDKRWESSFTHFARYFDTTYGKFYKKTPDWTPDLREAHTDILDIIFQSIPHLHEGAEYQGRSVTLNKPFRTPKGPKKFSVYVKNDKGNVVKVNFGDPNMDIKRDDPERRKNFRARHGCDNPGPKWKAKYWSCQWGWGRKKISDLT